MPEVMGRLHGNVKGERKGQQIKEQENLLPFTKQAELSMRQSNQELILGYEKHSSTTRGSVFHYLRVISREYIEGDIKTFEG